MNYGPIPSNFSFVSHSGGFNAVIQDIIKISSVEDVSTLVNSYGYCPWLFSLLGSICVGLCGIFPLLVITIDDEVESLKFGDGSKKLRLLLSFAVGGLLGDVFLHLLPEAWEYRTRNGSPGKGHPSISCGLWVLCGMLAFVILEKVFSNLEQFSSAPLNKCHSEEGHTDVQLQRPPLIRSPSDTANNNSNSSKSKDKNAMMTHSISGYLNLAANSIDNFTHGLAIGTSFCISFKLGVFSTFAILVHELPHEVGDFAILLKSGFSRWEAARAQVLTASGGIIGAMVAVMNGVTNTGTSWILPFTAGGFLHIALVSVLPELIREENRLESAKQICSLVGGIAVMAVLIIFLD